MRHFATCTEAHSNAHRSTEPKKNGETGTICLVTKARNKYDAIFLCSGIPSKPMRFRASMVGLSVGVGLTVYLSLGHAPHPAGVKPQPARQRRGSHRYRVANNMTTIKFELPADLFNCLETAFPQGPRNNSTRDRAIHIVRHWLLQQEDTQIVDIPTAPGADLTYTHAGKEFHIEIKGTEDVEIAWSKLKVSGQPSCDGISGGWPVYRVCGVFSRQPTIYIMKNLEDFILVPEPRWRFREIKIAQTMRSESLNSSLVLPGRAVTRQTSRHGQLSLRGRCKK
jgi:hypothetical protein